jgi:hypothetical protein
VVLRQVCDEYRCFVDEFGVGVLISQAGERRVRRGFRESDARQLVQPLWCRVEDECGA